MEQSLESSAEKHGRDMTVGSIPRHLVLFSVPMLVGNMVQTAYGVVNAIWVGQGPGKLALAAVAISMQVLFLIMAISIGITMGTSILIAQFAGAKNWERLRSTVQTSTLVLMSASMILFIIGEFFAPWLVQVVHTPKDVYPLAVDYLRIILISTPFSFGLYLAGSMLRGIGDSKTPLYFQIAGLAATAILDPLLIFGWLGFPCLGLNGTAIATVFTQAVTVVAMFIYLNKNDHLVAPDWLHLRVDWPTTWLILKIGLPSILQQAMVALGMFVVMSIVNRFGDNAIAALSAGNRIDGIAFLPAMTFNVAVSTLVGQNLGAGQYHRVRDVFRWGILLCGGITLLVAILAAAMPGLLLRMFLKDAAVIEIGSNYLRIIAFNYVLFAVMMIGNGVINGSGHTLVTTGISLIALWIGRVPLAYYLTNRMHKVEGVWYAIVLSSIVSVVISLAFYYGGIWKRPVIRHGVMPARDERNADNSILEMERLSDGTA